MKHLVALILIVLTVQSYAQKDTISLYELYAQILNGIGGTQIDEYDADGEITDTYFIYEISNKVIQAGKKGGAFFNGDTLTSSNLNHYLNHEVTDHYPIESRLLRVGFKNCVFTEFVHFFQHNYAHLTFENCSFKNDLSINDCELENVSFNNSVFEGEKLEMHGNEISGKVEFNNNTFQELSFVGIRGNLFIEDLVFENNTCNKDLKLWLKENSISNKVVFTSTDIWSLTIEENTFYSTDPDTFEIEYKNVKRSCPSNERLVFWNILSGTEHTSSLWLLRNKFESETGTEEMIFSGVFNDVLFLENDIGWRVEFSSSTVEKSFWLETNKFKSDVCFDSFIFSEMLNSISWEQLSGFKLSTNLYDGSYSPPKQYGRLMDLPIVMKGEENEMGNPQAKHLIRVYKSIYDICKKNGDIESANGCYAEMKQVETRRWKYLYQQNKSFESFFRWQLNAFLSYFTDYGTNPAKAVIKSGWVILLFAIFYLFFPSDWDISNRSQLLSKVKDLTSKNREKSFMATLAFVAYSGLIHILNALTLSLNAFTTLGFGDIPTHGAARYVTIVQGFIGWFLLTIFSVSLINQVLG